MKGLTDIPGIKVGHLSDYKAITGCTAILCEGGAVAGVDVRGSATGSQELDVLNPLHVTDRIHGICLAGRSAFGLEAACGVRKYLEAKKIGFQAGKFFVPIVPAAILFDLGIGDGSVRPNREMGEAAAAAANDGIVEEGCVGAGTGATVGKLFGMARAMKSGIGTFTMEAGGNSGRAIVSALVVVNALGDVRDPHTGRIIAGARKSAGSHEFEDSEAAMIKGASGGFTRSNTTLAVVATNARLSKTGATKLAQLASLGVARAIAPVNTMSDGDMVFALSLGESNAGIDTLGATAAEVLAQAITRAVRSAKTMGGVPGYFEV
jgi:L-aminopeptidase/D-esterase-like protein